jgi:hypothetical protein
MAGNHQSRAGNDRTHHANSAGASGHDAAPESPGRSMLDDVVAQTSEQLTAPEELEPAVRAALAAVARQYAGQPLTLDPAGVALVEALLRAQFPLLATRQALLANTARTVAESLLTDPDARPRVEHLWAQLGEEIA